MMSSSETCGRDKTNQIDVLSNTKELELKQLEATEDAEDENVGGLRSSDSSRVLLRPSRETRPSNMVEKERLSGAAGIEQIEGIFKENDPSEESGSLHLKKKAIASPRTKLNPGQKRKKRKLQK